VTVDEIESAWSTLRPPHTAHGISGRRAVGLPADRPLYLALDSQGRRHLMVQVADGTTPVAARDTRSLEVSTARFQVGENPEALFVDIVCTDSSQHHTFSAITQDLIRSVSQGAGPATDSILSALARWRSFWTVKPGGMSRESANGLFGELWFLRRWLGPASASLVGRWQVTDSARHDFQWASASVEVKTATSQSAGAPIHRIGSIEQLGDPEQGQLYLFSLQVCDDALAANTLHSLVASLVADLQSDAPALSEFRDKLASRGYSPADGQAPARSLRILGERLYRVDPAFPRLTRSNFEPAGLPVGIVGIEYLVDLSACDEWLVADNPAEARRILVGADS
jgi:hypothetical protein